MFFLAILDIFFTLFVVKLIAGFIFSRIDSRSRWQCGSASASDNCQSQSQPKPWSCKSSAQTNSIGQCSRRETPFGHHGQHPFRHFFQSPAFQVFEFEFQPQQQTAPVRDQPQPVPAATQPTVVVPVTPVHTFKTEDKQFVLSVEVPGFSRSQLTTTITDDLRQIKVEGKNETRKPVELTVIVPRLGDLGGVNAVLEDGILTVVIPKVERDGRIVTVGSAGKATGDDGYVVA
ncbi:hypothetical protein BCR33DRAFT_717895 [Rhizoclosmatium globosum]|uniref:SHSP domain-containing protein n=1 Tax=Rhizoclosmatium globosum TaxID=329046 RepID=A0A1Y2C800_9FUNG|nr:hypothetical protein BCR33DRAFT_717895 [Rhizoclosmatium globosum]|eukprot:ORY43159.1 hypothetical protein BCR33DRAFT_717895 [Rhizoclosmatium globosum]